MHVLLQHPSCLDMNVCRAVCSMAWLPNCMRHCTCKSAYQLDMLHGCHVAAYIMKIRLLPYNLYHLQHISVAEWL